MATPCSRALTAERSISVRDSWPTVGRAGAILDNLIAEHRAVPMIVVTPARHISRDFQLRTGQNTMGRDKFNEDLTGSVIPYVDKNYRTVADRDHRSLAGLSMGGLQTLDISLSRSDLFAYVGVFSSGWFSEMREHEEGTDLAQYKASGQPFKLYWVARPPARVRSRNLPLGSPPAMLLH